ncbi:aspartate-tRNA ligase [Xylariaceae sp. FL0255]|nr:aspartate-tRNA ligase [Xylariaceae sp. FL0255]
MPAELTSIREETQLGRHYYYPQASTATGEKVYFEARVESILGHNTSSQFHLKLREQHNLINATIDSHIVGEQSLSEALKLTPETIVRVSGQFRPTEDGKDTELAIDGYTVIGKAASDLPFKRHHENSNLQLEERLNNRILDVRQAASGAIFKLHSGMCQMIVEFLFSNGFHWVHTPRIITAAVAGDNEFFNLPYFGRNDIYLAQSSQHHKQMAISMDMQRVFEIGPVFRAEKKSSTSARHMTEFTVLDIGMTFEEEYHEVTKMVEDMLVFVLRGLQERKQFRNLTEIVKKLYPSAREFRIGLNEKGEVPRITFMEAKRVLREELGFDAPDNKNFTDAEEAALGKHFRNSTHLGQTDIFTIDQFPASMRQFNSILRPDGTSNTWDTIIGGREICSGSQRYNEYEDVRKALKAGVCGPPMDPDSPQWSVYLNMFKSGMPRHGGVGLGVNRLLQSYLGLDDVREVTLFPRDVNRVTP